MLYVMNTSIVCLLALQNKALGLGVYFMKQSLLTKCIYKRDTNNNKQAPLELPYASFCHLMNP